MADSSTSKGLDAGSSGSATAVAGRRTVWVALKAAGTLLGFFMAGFTVRNAMTAPNCSPGCPAVLAYRDDGIVADFTTSELGYPRNAMREIFGVFSDLKFGGESRASYKKWRRESSADDDYFLQVRYSLHPPLGSRVGYAGVFTSFSQPPQIPYDISAFTGIQFDLRVDEKALHESTFEVAVTLPTADWPRDPPGSEDWSEACLSGRDLRPGWLKVTMPFSRFGKAKYSGRTYAFNRTRVFQLSFAVRAGTTMEEGELDLDNIRFVRDAPQKIEIVLYPTPPTLPNDALPDRPAGSVRPSSAR